MRLSLLKKIENIYVSAHDLGKRWFSSPVERIQHEHQQRPDRTSEIWPAHDGVSYITPSTVARPGQSPTPPAQFSPVVVQRLAGSADD